MPTRLRPWFLSSFLVLSWMAPAAGLGEAGGGGGVPQPVAGLACRCLAPGVVELTWRNQDTYDMIVILLVNERGEQFQIEIPGDLERFPVQDLPPGDYTVEVTGVRQGVPSRPATCTVSCPPPPQPAITGPGTLILVRSADCPPGADGVEAVFDARSSSHPLGPRALRFFWQSPAPGVEILEPRSAVTRVRFPSPGEFPLSLTVVAPPTNEVPDPRPATLEQTVVVLAGTPEPPRFTPVHPLYLKVFLGGVADIPLSLEAGAPPLRFELLEGPDGIRLLQCGRLLWRPGRDQVQTIHAVSVRVVSQEGDEAIQELAIEVLDPAFPPLLYGFRAAAAPGGGGEVVPAAEVLGDLTEAPLGQPLVLTLPPGTPECAVVGIEPDEEPGGDRFHALRFAPDCGGGGGQGRGGGVTIGGFYASGSAAATLFTSIDNDLTIELWLSQVPASQPGAGAGPDEPAYIFSMSEGLTGVNWLVGTSGGGEYVAQINTDDQDDLVRVSGLDFSDATPHQLVFVRERVAAGGGVVTSSHRFYADGVLALEETRDGALDWSPDFEVFLASAEGGVRPFSGDLHTASLYSEALSDGMIGALFDLGPGVPEPSDIPPPAILICPDPHEILRGGYDASGTRSGLELGGGGGGGLRTCDEVLELLRPFEWTVTPETAPAPAILPWTPEEASCLQRVTVDFPDPETTGVNDFTVHLRVIQVPVRGVTKESTADVPASVPFPTGTFKRGDSNCDDMVNIADGVFTLQWLFQRGPGPCCRDAVDANDDGGLNISDPTYTFLYLFRGGPPPLAPGPDLCGADSTLDGLDCAANPHCL